jgi:hypothetical protein
VHTLPLTQAPNVRQLEQVYFLNKDEGSSDASFVRRAEGTMRVDGSLAAAALDGPHDAEDIECTDGMEGTDDREHNKPGPKPKDGKSGKTTRAKEEGSSAEKVKAWKKETLNVLTRTTTIGVKLEDSIFREGFGPKKNEESTKPHTNTLPSQITNKGINLQRTELTVPHMSQNHHILNEGQ